MALQTKHKIGMGAGAGIVAAALTVIMPSEGKRNVGYADPIGIPTICYGHTGADVRVGEYASDAQCKDLLTGDVKEAFEGVVACTNGNLTPKMAAAFTSTAYNIGVQKFCSSTIARKAKQGDWKGACAELSRWVNAGGKPLPGLVTRRAKERALCESDIN
jgi:lysozyme